jgi:hypothetical protein
MQEIGLVGLCSKSKCAHNSWQNRHNNLQPAGAICHSSCDGLHVGEKKRNRPAWRTDLEVSPRGSVRVDGRAQHSLISVCRAREILFFIFFDRRFCVRRPLNYWRDPAKLSLQYHGPLPTCRFAANQKDNARWDWEPLPSHHWHQSWTEQIRLMSTQLSCNIISSTYKYAHRIMLHSKHTFHAKR